MVSHKGSVRYAVDMETRTFLKINNKERIKQRGLTEDRMLEHFSEQNHNNVALFRSKTEAQQFLNSLNRNQFLPRENLPAKMTQNGQPLSIPQNVNRNVHEKERRQRLLLRYFGRQGYFEQQRVREERRNEERRVQRELEQQERKILHLFWPPRGPGDPYRYSTVQIDLYVEIGPGSQNDLTMNEAVRKFRHFTDLDPVVEQDSGMIEVELAVYVWINDSGTAYLYDFWTEQRIFRRNERNRQRRY